MVIWFASQKRNVFFFKRKYLTPLAIFFSLFFLTTGFLVLTLLSLNIRDPLLGAHQPKLYSLGFTGSFCAWWLLAFCQFDKILLV